MANVDDCQNFEFTSFRDFQIWKTKEENITNTRFIKARGDEKFKGYITNHLKCHRSGKFVPKGTGKRYLKVQGSSKINSCCPAKIKAKCFEAGNVSVRYFSRHEGHTNDPNHLFIRKEHRQQIAARLSLGVPFKDIINHTRKEAGDDASLQLISKQDLKNIYREYNLDKSMLLKNDKQSLTAWVQLMKYEDECTKTDNIETVVEAVTPDDNLPKTVLDTCSHIVDKYKDNPTSLKRFLAGVKKLDFLVQIFENGGSSLFTSLTREPEDENIKQKRKYIRPRKTRSAMSNTDKIVMNEPVIKDLSSLNCMQSHSFIKSENPDKLMAH